MLKARTEDAAKAELAAFAAARRALVTQRRARTIGDLWALWLADRAEDGFDNAIYEANWKAMENTFAHRDPAQITKADCRGYARARFDAGRAAWTVVTELTRLRACLNWAESHGHIAKAPFVWVPSKGKPRDRALTADEMRRLISAAAEGDPHVMVFVWLAVQTGARHTAILDLTWDRVDFVAGTISYDERLPPDPMSKAWKKGRATVPMGRHVREVLLHAKRGARTRFVVEHGGRRIKSIREGFAAAVRRAGLPGKVTPHTLRHSVATLLRSRDVEYARTARLLGHEDERTTQLNYTHTDAQYLVATVEIIDAALASKPDDT